MSIKTVTTDDLRRMNGKEGLVLQGCGGDPQEWLDGINGLLTDEGILKNGSKFENISVFQNGSLTNILFPFEDGVEIDMGKLANPKDREVGLAAGMSLLWLCDEVWVFGDTVTDGMSAELKFCKNLNIRVRKITEKEIQKAIGGNPL